MREERAIEANGPFHTQGGAFAGTPRVDEDQRRDLIAQSEIVRSQIHRQGGAITPEELREKTDRLGAGRSAIFGSDAASGHYSDPQVGKVRYEDELLDRGSELRRPEDREAVAWAIAAGPDVAKQAFEPEWNTFGHRQPEADGSPGGGQGPAAPYLKTNPDAFSFGGAAKRPRP
ncbi:MAG TPA: hypothetical protein VGV36_04730 [Solirubrobacteraceae bacterium]|nr:hypothetical protein [Solirubrobacteraceae bacterium]